MQYIVKRVQYYNEYYIKSVHFVCKGNAPFGNGNVTFKNAPYFPILEKSTPQNE